MRYIQIIQLSLELANEFIRYPWPPAEFRRHGVLLHTGLGVVYDLSM